MNYRHGFHAGNFADVVKHATLARIIAHLREKPTPFRVIDTHAGAGLYDLKGLEASRTGEWREGIARLLQARLTPEIRILLAPYLDAVAALNPAGRLTVYPGSPLLVRAWLRPRDRLIACELEPQAAAALAKNLANSTRAKVMAIDGWTALSAYVPPKERRGLVLIDPPYEDAQEMQHIAKVFAEGRRRFAHGITLVWHPLKSSMPADALMGELKTAGAGKLLSLIFDVGTASGDTTGRLSASGLLAINPPYGFAEEMHAAQEELLPLLRRSANAGTSVTWLAGGR